MVGYKTFKLAHKEVRTVPRKLLFALLMVLTLAFLTQVITVAQVGPPTPPSDDPNSSSTQGTSNSSTNQQTYGPSSSDEFLFPPWILTPFGCEWVEVCWEVSDNVWVCEWILICEDWVLKLGLIFIP